MKEKEILVETASRAVSTEAHLGKVVLKEGGGILGQKEEKRRVPGDDPRVLSRSLLRQQQQQQTQAHIAVCISLAVGTQLDGHFQCCELARRALVCLQGHPTVSAGT